MRRGSNACRGSLDDVASGLALDDTYGQSIDLEVQRENLAAGYPVSYSARPAGVVGLPERRSLVPSGEREPETLAFDSASDGLDLVGFDWLACTTQ